MAASIQDSLKSGFADRDAVLAIVQVGDDPVSTRYVGKKQALAETIGVECRLFEFDISIEQEELIAEIKRIGGQDSVTGLIVQLPLPTGFDTSAVLEAIPSDKDVDALGSESPVDSPVVEACKEIIERSNVELEGKSEEDLKKAAKKADLDWKNVEFHDAKWIIENIYKIPVGKMRWFTFDKFE